jgi:DNA-directed RNA polymerase specialized sigma24 family protein
LDQVKVIAHPNARFPSTQSRAVFLAGHGDGEERKRAQDELCRQYWLPLQLYARRRGYSRDMANDLTQGFLARLFDKNDLARVDLGRQTFRPWLRRCFSSYMANVRDHDLAWCHGGRAVHVSCDTAKVERYEALTARAATPDIAFEQARSLLVLERAFEALRAEWLRKGRARWFETLQEFVTYEDERPYENLSSVLGAKVGTIRAEVSHLRRRYRELLCNEVARGTSGPEQLAEELRNLLLVLIPKPAPTPTVMSWPPATAPTDTVASESA